MFRKRFFSMIALITLLFAFAARTLVQNISEDDTICTVAPVMEEDESVAMSSWTFETEETLVPETEVAEPIIIDTVELVELESFETVPLETEPVYVEQFTEVPWYYQTDYPDVWYGTGSIATHGCGITSLSMVLTYLLDSEIMPDALAEQYRAFHSGKSGSSWTLFPDSAEDYGVVIEEQTWDWNKVLPALENGQVVIANARHNIFTKGGHFIVLYGLTEDGKVLVRDPYRGNSEGEWVNPVLLDGFENGFDQKWVRYCAQYWVYGPKDLDAIAAQAGDSVTQTT